MVNDKQGPQIKTMEDDEMWSILSLTILQQAKK